MAAGLRTATALALAALLGGCSLEGGPPDVGAAARSRPPAGLVRTIGRLGRGFDGRVGIAVQDVQTGWTAAFDGRAAYPQQSVSKLWVALTAYADVDAGFLSLDEPVVVRPADLSVFNQPIAKLMGPQGYATTLDGLLQFALARSDNAADDMLDRRVGGEAVVQTVIDDRGLDGAASGPLRAGPPEHILQSEIAGLDWRPEYAFGQAFWTARAALPYALRRACLDAYLADPPDAASPLAVAAALARLDRGELLSPVSTARFLQVLGSTETGPKRLKAGLPPGWTIAHKTGTGQELADPAAPPAAPDLATGYNDVGLITAPDGRAYAVAVMIAATRRPIPDRQALMAAVARAVVQAHDDRSR